VATASSPFPAIRSFTRRHNWGGGCARHAMRPCSASRVGAADNQAKFFGRFTEFALPTVVAAPETIAGPDGNPWFTDMGTNKIGRITPSGRAGVAPPVHPARELPSRRRRRTRPEGPYRPRPFYSSVRYRRSRGSVTCQSPQPCCSIRPASRRALTARVAVFASKPGAAR